jgi:hypothetical protein
VRPAREFGALARKEGEWGNSEGDSTVWTEVGEAAHVQPSGLPSEIELISGFAAVKCARCGGLF